jgi:hypothetical protein
MIGPAATPPTQADLGTAITNSPTRRHGRYLPSPDRPRAGPYRDGMLRTGLVLLLAVGLLGAGCSSEQPAPQPSPPSEPPPSSAAPLLTRYPGAELARQPCRALDARDLAALGITEQGTVEDAQNGPTCHWKVADQNVNLDLDVPQARAQDLSKKGRVSKIPVGLHTGVQSEFQNICFIFVPLHDPDRLVGSTTIPEPQGSQSGACPAGAAVVAAALTHLQ